MAKQDIKAGTSFVELLLKDNAFVKGLARAGKMLKSFAKGAALAGAATVAAGVAIAGVGLKNFLALGDELDKMRQRTGLSVEALSELKHAAGQSGSSLVDVEKGVRRMQKGLVDAQSGLVTSAEAFTDLGISVEALAAMSPEDQFTAVAEAIGAVEDPTRRAGLAMNVFGKSGTALLPMIEDMGDLRQEARDLGFVLSGEAAASAVRVGDMFANLWSTLKMGTVAIGAAFSPILEVALPAIQSFATMGLKAINVMANGIVTVMDGVRVAWGIIWDSIGGIVVAVWGDTTNVTQGAMVWFQNAIMTSLQAVSFAFKEWRLLVDIAVMTAGLGIVSFANDVMHLFTQVIPTYLTWMADAWKTTFGNVVNYVKGFATEVGLNMHMLWASIQNFMSGGGWAFEWTNLQDAAANAIKGLPEIAEREMGAVESAMKMILDGLNGELDGKWEQHQKDFQAKIEKFRAERGLGAGDNAPALDAMGGFNAAAAKREVFVAFSAAAAVGRGRGEGGNAEERRHKEAQAERIKQRRAIEEGGALV